MSAQRRQACSSRPAGAFFTSLYVLVALCEQDVSLLVDAAPLQAFSGGSATAGTQRKPLHLQPACLEWGAVRSLTACRSRHARVSLLQDDTSTDQHPQLTFAVAILDLQRLAMHQELHFLAVACNCMNEEVDVVEVPEGSEHAQAPV